MSFALLLALMAPAQAESEMVFRTAGPVLIFVDGRQAPLTSSLKMRAKNLEPGEHSVRVQGVFGKTLYEGDVAIDDWTVTHMEWAGGGLEVSRTDNLTVDEPADGQWSDPEEIDEPTTALDAGGESELEQPMAEEPEPEAPDELAEVVAPQAVLVEEAPPSGGPPLAIPIGPAAMPVQEAVIAEVIPELSPEPVPDIPLGPPTSTLVVQGYEGVQVELEYGDARLYVSIVDGVFVVSDQTGVQVRFGENP